jgi:hypothetical protein
MADGSIYPLLPELADDPEVAAVLAKSRVMTVADAPTHLGPCWVWVASLTVRGGYAQARLKDGRVVRVHRWLYQRVSGVVPITLDLDHLCRVRHCIRPAHLEPVTRQVNLARGVGNKPRTHCRRGHAVTGSNVYQRPGSGRRECLTCKVDRRAHG